MQQNQTEEIVGQALQALDAGDYRGALVLLLPLAEAGHVQSQSIVGGLYMESLQRMQDVEEAGGWDSVSRELLLAWEETDHAEALRWLTLASEQGNGPATHNLAMLCSIYPGTTPPEERKVIAKRLLRKGYEQGFAITAFDEDDMAYLVSVWKRPKNAHSMES